MINVHKNRTLAGSVVGKAGALESASHARKLRISSVIGPDAGGRVFAITE